MKAKMIAVMATATLAFAGAAHAEGTKNFDGFYVGGEFGYTYESQLDDIYYGAVVGGRKQFDNDLVLGVEATFGKAEIPFLQHIWTANGTVGYAFGADKRNLVFAGLGYVELKASAFGFTAKGSDVSSLIGYERTINDYLSFRVKANMYSDTTVTTTVGLVARF